MLWRAFILILVAAGASGETKEAVSRTLALFEETGEQWKTLAPMLDSVEGAFAAPVDAVGMGYGVLADQVVGVGRALLTGLTLYAPERLAAEAARFERARQWLRSATPESTVDRMTGKRGLPCPTERRPSYSRDLTR
jgi:hypothetical protein